MIRGAVCPLTAMIYNCMDADVTLKRIAVKVVV